MEKFVDIFIDDPFKAISILAVTLVFWFIKREQKHRDEQFNDFKARMKEWKQDIDDIVNVFVVTAREHQESMGSLQHQFRQLNKHLNYKLEEMQKYIESLNSSGLVSVQKMIDMNQMLYNRFGAIVDISKKLDSTYGKVINLQGDSEEMKIGLVKHREQIGKIARYLEHQRQKDLDKDKK